MSKIEQMTPLTFAGNFIDLLEQGDMFCLLIGGLLLMLVAQHAGKSHEEVQKWGTRIGVLAFVGWYVRDFFVNGLESTGQLVTTGIRALLVLLYVTNVAWLMLAIGFTAMGCEQNRKLRRAFQKWWASGSKIQTPATVTPKPDTHDVEPAHSAEEEARLLEAVEARANEQLERDEIRFGLELLYDRYRHELKDLLPPEHFAEYFKTRLTNDLSVEAYKSRTEQVTRMIRDRLQLTDEDSPAWQSVHEIITEFNTRAQRLSYHDLDEDTLETLRLQITEERNAAVQQHLSGKNKRRSRL